MASSPTEGMGPSDHGRGHTFSSSLWHPYHLFPAHPIHPQSPIYLLLAASTGFFHSLSFSHLCFSFTFELTHLSSEFLLHRCMLLLRREKGAGSQEELLAIMRCTEWWCLECSHEQKQGRTWECSKPWPSSRQPAIDMQMILWTASTTFWKILK